MSGRRFWLVAAVVAAAVVVGGCSAQQGTTGGSTDRSRSVPNSPPATGGSAVNSANEYRVELTPLNGSGVSGEATVTVTGTTIRVVLRAEGLSADDKHPQHIHGFRNNKASTMPSETTGLTDQDAEQFIGPPLLALEPYPVPDADGTYLYEGTFEDVSMIFPLQIRAIEIHGMMVDGKYDFTRPVAAGLLRQATAGGSGNGSSDGSGGSNSGGSSSDTTRSPDQTPSDGTGESTGTP